MSTKNDELIFKDEKELKKVEANLQTATAKLNEFVKKTIEFVGEKNSINIEDLKNNGIQIISNEIKSKFQFPNANDKFNLEALGIDPEPLYNFYQNNFHIWQPFQFEVKEGIFVACNEQLLITQCYYYANSPERRQLMKLANNVIDLYNNLKNTNLINGNHFWGSFAPGLLTMCNNNNLSISPTGIKEILKNVDNGIFKLNT